MTCFFYCDEVFDLYMGSCASMIWVSSQPEAFFWCETSKQTNKRINESIFQSEVVVKSGGARDDHLLLLTQKHLHTVHRHHQADLRLLHVLHLKLVLGRDDHKHRNHRAVLTLTSPGTSPGTRYQSFMLGCD